MAQPQNNRITIFSNGIADFCRMYRTTGKPQRIDLPVHQEHLGDVLASLIICGPVTLAAPPCFAPDNETESILALASEDVFQDIGRKLRGADIEVEKSSGDPIKGKLFGLDSEETAARDGATVRRYFYQVLTERGLERVLQEQVKRIQFVQESVQSEIDKALQRAFQTIKPGSTTVSLEVTCDREDHDFFLRYTVPAAAWKMTYRLRTTDDGILFDGVAIVDNNTEEDWDDFIVGLVTGEPITFSTDVTKTKIPSRKHVNLVSQQAQGAVEFERGFSSAACVDGEDTEDFYEDDGMRLPAAISRRSYPMLHEAPAMEADAGHREVGDFSVFQFNSPLTIKSGQSATIPVFNTELRDARPVLFYKFHDHSERPFRTIRFRNETDQNLCRGVCTVYVHDTYSGSSVLPPTKKGEDVMLCHALETGVRVRYEPGKEEQEIVAVRIADGVIVTTHDLTRRSKYIVNNIKPEEFDFILDHQKIWNGDLTCTMGEKVLESSESLKNGDRFVFKLPPGEILTLAIKEQRTREQRISADVSWLKEFFIAAEHRLDDDSDVREVIRLQVAVGDVEEQQKELNSRLQVIKDEQERVAGLVEKDPNNDQWKQDLRTTEEEIREITRRKQLELAERLKAARIVRNEALGRLVCNWNKPE